MGEQAGEPLGVEMFGMLELQLNSSNTSGYCDVYPLKDRKKKPWQAKIPAMAQRFYQPWHFCQCARGSGGGGTAAFGGH